MHQDSDEYWERRSPLNEQEVDLRKVMGLMLDDVLAANEHDRQLNLFASRRQFGVARRQGRTSGHHRIELFVLTVATYLCAALLSNPFVP